VCGYVSVYVQVRVRGNAFVYSPRAVTMKAIGYTPNTYTCKTG